MSKNKLLKAAFLGMKQNFIPGIILQIFALSIVLMYYNLDFAEGFFKYISAMKKEYGYIFSAISTAIFGGIIPFILLSITGKIKKKFFIITFVFYVLVWMWKGIEVDAFYRLQGVLFGDKPTIYVTLKKTFVDQFVYNPIWAAPSLTIVYLWRDCDFSFRKLKSQLNIDFITFKVPSVLLSTWFIWIPAVLIIYQLPQDLQLPLFNIILCFWALLLSYISNHNTNYQ